METKSDLPIYESIKKNLRGRIDRGELKPGDRVPSELELAKSLGVSRSQTRQALRELELEGYIERIQGSGSFVRPQHLRKARGSTPVRPKIAMAYPRLAEKAKCKYMESIIQGFIDSVASQEFDPMFYYLAQNREAELAFLASVQHSDINGLALWPQYESEEETRLVRDMSDCNFPCVLFDHDLPSLEVDFVGTANRTAFRRLTNALLQRGHESVAYITLSLEGPVMRDRLAGYSEALEHRGLPQSVESVGNLDIPFDSHFSEITFDEIKKRIKKTLDSILAHRPTPTAFVISDIWTTGYIWAQLDTYGMVSSNQLDIATMDDKAGTDGPSDQRWLSMVQDGYSIGQQVGELIGARIAEPTKAMERRLVPAKLLFEEGATHEAQQERMAKVS